MSARGRRGTLAVWLRVAAMALATVALALFPLAVAGLTAGRKLPVARAGRWAMHLWARALCALLGVRIRVDGTAPQGPHLFTSNHLGYLDVLVLGAAYPTLFLSMAEVARWPGIGSLARLAGTLFIARGDRADVERARAELALHLRAGLPVTLFPEAYPSPGAGVAPFHAALLESAVATGSPCVPVSITYDTPQTDEPPSTAVCWWGDMAFLPHARRLARIRRIEARVVLGAPVAAGADRKALAATLHARVRAAFRPVRQDGAGADSPRGRMLT